MVLRPGELDSIRRPFEQRMTATAVIWRKTQTSDDAGGFIDVYAPAHTAPCNYTPYPITPLERETAARVQVSSYWRFVFPAGTDVLSTDRIVVGERRFEVVQAGAGLLEIQLQAICLEIA